MHENTADAHIIQTRNESERKREKLQRTNVINRNDMKEKKKFVEDGGGHSSSTLD